MKAKYKYLSNRCAILFCCLYGIIGLLLFLWSKWVFGSPGGLVQWGIVTALCVASAYLFFIWIYRPYRESEKVLRLFSEGYMMGDVFSMRNPYSLETEKSYVKVEEMMDRQKLISVSKKQAEYLALQNQINPHFLYNTLEGIRSEAVIAGMGSVAAMTKALGTFFRYTISSANQIVTLEDELLNIRNYYIIQQFRFGDKLNLKIVYEDGTDEKEVLEYCLPKLTLQPIVENSIYHGIEPKLGVGELCIRILVTMERLLIRVSDNGLGIEEHKLKEMNEKLKTLNLERITSDKNHQGGIAVVNVNNRIKLLFGEDYGVHMYSMYKVGTDVEITLPLLKSGVMYER